MKIPDFSKPSKDCYLTVDKHGNKLKAGDVIQISEDAGLLTFKGDQKAVETYKPVEEKDGNLVIPHYGSFLLDYYVRKYCEIVN